jgi:hypothetical protein
MNWQRFRWCGIAALVIGPVATAKAESSLPLPEESVTELRRRAMQALDAGRPEEGFRLFRTAWELQKNYFDICSLAQFQMDRKKWRDASESYAICKRALPELMTSSTKLFIERDSQRARSHVGAITVTANVPGAEVRVDGETVGKIPLDYPIFVDPGWCAVDVRAPGYASVGKVFEMEAGGSDAWAVQLEPSKASAGPIVQESASPAPKATQEPVSPAPKTSTAPPVSAPIKGSPQGVSPIPTASLGSQGYLQEATGRESNPLQIAGLTLGLVGFGVATASFVGAFVAQTQADELTGGGGGLEYKPLCSGTTVPSTCVQVARLGGKAEAFGIVGLGSLAICATGLALLTYDILRPSSSKDKASAQGAIAVVPGGGALRVSGSF